VIVINNKCSYFINSKIDSEGAEAPIIRGGSATIQRCRPVIVFETGMNTTPAFGETLDSIYDLMCEEFCMTLTTMQRWLDGRPPLSRRAFRKSYEPVEDFYFLAYS
jgi:Methyltransferase FkbM domain